MTEPYYVGHGVTLYHGDALELTDWVGADVLVTDPPYGVKYRCTKALVKQREPLPRVAGDHSTDARDAALELWALLGDRPALVFGTWKQPRPADVRAAHVGQGRRRGGHGRA